jgi:hypothetical protein
MRRPIVLTFVAVLLMVGIAAAYRQYSRRSPGIQIDRFVRTVKDLDEPAWPPAFSKVATAMQLEIRPPLSPADIALARYHSIAQHVRLTHRGLS